jgi:hypothetical protein
MPKVRMDLSEAISFKPVDAGTYPAEVVEVKDAKSSDKATFLPIVLEISEGEAQGRKLFHNIMLSGKGAGRGADELGNLLGEEIDPDAMDEFAFDTDDLIGATCQIVVSQREWPEGSGDMQNDVKKVLKA